jgi:hypothetical protein
MLRLVLAAVTALCSVGINAASAQVSGGAPIAYLYCETSAGPPPAWAPCNSGNPVPITGAGSGGTSSTFGAVFPATGTAAGASNGTDMEPFLVDGSGYLEVNVKAGGAGGGAVFGPTAAASPAANPPVLLGGTVDGTATGNVDNWKVASGIGYVSAAVTSSALPTGAATSANQSTEITSLSTIATNTGAAIPDCGSLPCTNKIGALAPLTATSTQTKVTITTGGTYQQYLASNTARKGCTIQFITAAHTGYVFFGAAPADTTTSFQLSPGQTLNCTVGNDVLTDAIQLTSSNNSDVFVVNSY